MLQQADHTNKWYNRWLYEKPMQRRLDLKNLNEGPIEYFNSGLSTVITYRILLNSLLNVVDDWRPPWMSGNARGASPTIDAGFNLNPRSISIYDYLPCVILGVRFVSAHWLYGSSVTLFSR